LEGLRTFVIRHFGVTHSRIHPTFSQILPESDQTFTEACFSGNVFLLWLEVGKAGLPPPLHDIPQALVILQSISMQFQQVNLLPVATNVLIVT